jgi:rfaE bifunctional protein nucleotidyltransferase chain/domain
MPKLALIQRKILRETDLDRWLTIARFQHRKIVFTNGCFDVLHKGHIEYLAAASALGDMLMIGMNTDASVTRLKGPSRPYLDEETRALTLAALGFVAVVVPFSDDTPYDLIKRVKPDVLVKGGDYKAEDIVGYDLVTGGGGKVVIIPLTPGFSSTRVITKMTGPA